MRFKTPFPFLEKNGSEIKRESEKVKRAKDEEGKILTKWNGKKRKKKEGKRNNSM